MTLREILKNIIKDSKEIVVEISFRTIIQMENSESADIWAGNAVYKSGLIIASDGDSWSLNLKVIKWEKNGPRSITVWY